LVTEISSSLQKGGKDELITVQTTKRGGKHLKIAEKEKGGTPKITGAKGNRREDSRLTIPKWLKKRPLNRGH